jgi:hypothetical protein
VVRVGKKNGKYSYFPGRREIPVFSGKYWEIRLNLNYRCFLPSLDHLATRFQRRRLKQKIKSETTRIASGCHVGKWIGTK